MKKSFLLLSALLALGILVSACGGATTPTQTAPETAAPSEGGEVATEAPAAERTTVTAWIPGDEGRWFIENNLEQVFEAANPQYDLVLAQMGWDVIHDKLVTGFAGGEVPDVALIGDHWVGEFAGLGGLRDVSSFVAEYGFTEDYWLPGAYEYFRLRDGNIYAIPALMEVRVLFYRTDLFEAAGIAAPPETLDELLQVGQALTNGVDQFGMADQTSWLDYHFFAWLLYAHGGDLYTPDRTTCLLDNEAGIAALEYYQSLYELNIIPQDPSLRTDTFTGFVNGYYAMAESGPWWFGLLQEQAPQISGQWAATVLPAGETTIAYGHPQPLILPAGAQNPDGGDAFAAWFISPETMAQWHEISLQVPAVAAAYDDPRLVDNPSLTVMRAAILRGQNSLYDVPHAEDISAVIWTMLEEVKNNTSTPQEAAATACTAMEAYLNE